MRDARETVRAAVEGVRPSRSWGGSMKILASPPRSSVSPTSLRVSASTIASSSPPQRQESPSFHACSASPSCAGTECHTGLGTDQSTDGVPRGSQGATRSGPGSVRPRGQRPWTRGDRHPEGARRRLGSGGHRPEPVRVVRRPIAQDVVRDPQPVAGHRDYRDLPSPARPPDTEADRLQRGRLLCPRGIAPIRARSLRSLRSQTLAPLARSHLPTPRLPSGASYTRRTNRPSRKLSSWQTRG